MARELPGCFPLEVRYSMGKMVGLTFRAARSHAYVLLYAGHIGVSRLGCRAKESVAGGQDTGYLMGRVSKLE